jgi:hypothetical protein
VSDHPIQNTDREIWNARDDHGYGPSIHVTKDGRVGINVGGTVIVRRVIDWHSSQDDLNSVRMKLHECKTKQARHCHDLVAYELFLRNIRFMGVDEEIADTIDRFSSAMGDGRVRVVQGKNGTSEVVF